MSCICPTVTANDLHGYRKQLEKIEPFAERMHLDFMDGDFAPTVSPDISQIWIPENRIVDIHIMYRNPSRNIARLIELKPNMVIVHAESSCDVPKFASELRAAGIKTGLAVLQDTKIADVVYLFPHIQHLLIFSGNLGHFGGTADLSLAAKIAEAKQIHKYLEIGWDGGINLENAVALKNAGVDVLNVGGAIQKAEEPNIIFEQLIAKVA
jgi:ribulose-phosphate 3-epimerase